MAGIEYTSPSVAVSDLTLNGGLNSTAGPLTLQNNESSDLQNIDFNKFGSVLKRNGYTALKTTAISGTPDIDGLFDFEVSAGGTTVASLVAIAGTDIFKMDDLDGTWDTITSAISITAGNHCDFANFQNILFITNGTDSPFNWDATRNGKCSVGEAVAGIDLVTAKYVELYNNYLFYGNVSITAASPVAHPSRIYWSNLKDTENWTSTDYIDIAQNDGQEITGLKILGDRLVIFKTRSIYNLYFTGDVDVPFVLPGGGKSNSTVGCIAPFSIQEVDNGLVFMSYDGFYFYDGLNSYKISDKINTTFLGLNRTKFANACSLVQKDKNRYWCALTSSGQSENDKVFIWDYFLNAWSIYDGLDPSAMTMVYVDNTEERPYWGDYAGFVYRGDTGTDDYPLNVSTVIDAYYYTNWKNYGDLIDKKGIPHIAIYHQISDATLTFAYSYDFESGDTYSQAVALSTSSDVYGTAKYGTATYARAGGNVQRKDLTGRGRVVRFKFANNMAGETFRVDGFGTIPHLETVA